MKKWLFEHNLKSIRRSPDFRRKLIFNIFFGLLLSIFILELLLLGIFLHRLINEDLLPGSNPLTVVNSALLYYFLIEFSARLFLQKSRLTSAKQYLLLKINRKTLANYILLKTLFTFFNILPLLIIIPFFINGVIGSNNILPSLAWLITILCLMYFNTYLANYSKMGFFRNPVKISIVPAIIITLLILEKFKIITFSSFSYFIFNSIIIYPILALVPPIMVYVIYSLNKNYMIGNLNLETASTGYEKYKIKEDYKFISGSGKFGSFALLDLKLLLRHKRSRVVLFMPLIFIFYGLLFYPSGEYNRDTFIGNFMLMFVGTFISGFFTLSYGITIFSNESKYFGLILTNRMNIYEFLRSKYYFMLVTSVVAYLLSSFYIYFGMKIFLINSVMFLFNLGVTPFVFIFLATFNKVKLDLNTSSMSLQGKSGNQFSAVFVLLFIILIIYLPFSIFIDKYAGFAFLGILGLLGLILHKPLLKLLVKQFQNRKYVMSEGFRHS